MVEATANKCTLQVRSSSYRRFLPTERFISPILQLHLDTNVFIREFQNTSQATETPRSLV